MVSILSFIGKSNSGKTTFIERLIPEMTKKGYAIATVKHDRSHGFEFDKKGKDSWRHKQAGAEATILSSPRVLALIRDVKEEASLDEIAFRYVEDADLLIAEGYKEGDHEKIEITTDLHEDDLYCKRCKSVIAVISDNKFNLDIPQFHRDAVPEVAEWIEKKFPFKNKNKILSLYVNSQRVSLKPLNENKLIKTIEETISTLKKCENPERIELRIVEKKRKK